MKIKKVTSADALEILRYSVKLKTTGKRGQKITLTETVHTHTWVEHTTTQRVKVKDGTDTDVASTITTDPEVHTYEILYGKCEGCGETIIALIWDLNKGRVNTEEANISHIPGHPEYTPYSYQFILNGEEVKDVHDWQQEHGFAHDWKYKTTWWREQVQFEVPGTEKTQTVINHVHTDPVYEDRTVTDYWYCSDCGERAYQSNKPNY